MIVSFIRKEYEQIHLQSKPTQTDEIVFFRITFPLGTITY